MKGIADTGFLVAFLNANDRHHVWAREVAGRVTDPLLTCEAVLAEAAFHLQDSAVVTSLVREGMIVPAFDCREHLEHLNRLEVRYADRRPDFADLCLVRMSEVYPRYAVVTVDFGGFSVYRRNKREAIPLLSPPVH